MRLIKLSIIGMHRLNYSYIYKRVRLSMYTVEQMSTEIARIRRVREVRSRARRGAARRGGGGALHI